MDDLERTKANLAATQAERAQWRVRAKQADNTITRDQCWFCVSACDRKIRQLLIRIAAQEDAL